MVDVKEASDSKMQQSAWWDVTLAWEYCLYMVTVASGSLWWLNRIDLGLVLRRALRYAPDTACIPTARRQM